MLPKSRFHDTPVLLLFAVVSAAVFLGSCDNPFRPDMGDQVVIGRPTISNIYPASNAILTGEVRFAGDAWAHRELRRVEVRLGNNTTGERFGDPGNPILDWTNISVFGGTIVRTEVPGEGIDGSWGFTFDTGNLPEAARPARSSMDDGMFRMRFRVVDNNEDPVYSEELVYSVKNLPSLVRMTFPTDEAIIESRNGADGDSDLRIMSGALVQGRISDVRGLRPGYPMIQVWPADRADITADPDAFAGDNRFGWASMFLVDPTSGVNDDPEYGDEGRYDGRAGTINVANFSFRLSSFNIVPRADGVRAAVYDGGELEMGPYLFRIITRDTRGITGHFPPLNHGNDPAGPDSPDPFSPGNPVAIYLINDASPPEISLAYPGNARAMRPTLYVTSGINERKVSVDDPSGPPRPVFRLQAVARHGDGITRATLRWDHPERGGGELELDADGGGAEGVPTGIGRGEVRFTFTATRDTRDAAGDIVFVSHSTAYTLTLRVWSRVGSYAYRTFSLVMDGAGPTVGVNPAVRGAYSPADGDAEPTHGGFINRNHVTVNGNIQVSLDRLMAGSGIMGHGEGRGVPPPAPGYQMVKWFAEPAAGDNPEGASVLSLIRAFQNAPSRENLAFFFYPTHAHHGWVSPPGPGPHPAYGTNNFKFDTTEWDNADLWLYVVAMDGLYNLGFFMQKIRVDQSTDVPRVDVTGFNPALGPGDLGVSFTGADPTSPGFISRPNVLQGGGTGIYLNLSDDDCIQRDVQDIVITLYRLDPVDFSSVLSSGTITENAQLSATLPNSIGQRENTPANARGWSGNLTQATMASVLGQPGNSLAPGTYRLDIRVRDSEAYKVQIGSAAPGQLYTEAYFYFAVHTAVPVIDVAAPGDMSFQGSGGIRVYGTVNIPGPWGLGSLWVSVSLDPDAPNPVWRHHRIPYGWDGAGLRSLGGGIYEWAKIVDFAPDDVEGYFRRFAVTAFDTKGFYARVGRGVRVDPTPPTIRFTGFNQGRPLSQRAPGSPANAQQVFEVWGNVHFQIEVADTSGIGTVPTPPDVDGAPPTLADVRWWLLPYGADSPEWDDPFPAGPDGAGGQFFAGAPSLSITEAFGAVFDSRPLQPGAEPRYFKLYVIAGDVHGNRNEPAVRLADGSPASPVNWIRVNQAADTPVLAWLDPPPPPPPLRSPDVGGNLFISGRALDTDGFYSGGVEIRIGAGPGSYSLHVLSGDEVDFDGDGGAVNFRFDVMGINPPLPDGPIWYEVTIRDHDGAIPDRTRNKNPQLDSSGEQVRTFLAAGNALPDINPMPSRSYTRAAGFILDTVPPEIVLDAPAGATFRNVDDLLAAFPGGTVTDDNIRYFAITFDGRTFRLLEGATTGSEHSWDWDMDVNLRAELDAWFHRAPQGLQTITFVAEDLAGNRSQPQNWNFAKDDIPPDLRLTGFNQGRPLNAENEFEVWGNVHFAITVTDAQSLGSADLSADAPPYVAGERMSNVKWWLLPYDAASPEWDDPFPDGTGGRFFYRGSLSATFNAVFDSRTLSETTTYNLYVIARDAAGNQTEPARLNDYPIRVNQNADLPVLTGLAPGLNPGEPAGYPIRRPDAAGNLRITGLVRDTDGFNPAVTTTPDPNNPGRFLLANDYVFIQFRVGDDWYPANPIPVPASLDGTGAVNFNFDVVTAAGFNPLVPTALRVDGTIRYRITFRDEPGYIPGRLRNKNPQLDPSGDPIHAFLTAGDALPTIPVATAGENYRNFGLILDRVAPLINANLVHTTPMFRHGAGLVPAIPEYSRTVTDANLRFLDVSFGGRTFRLLDGTSPNEWDWDRTVPVVVDGIPSPNNTANVQAELVSWFNSPTTGQGLQTVTFVAEDWAGNRSPALNWNITKDSQGPVLSLSGGTRRVIDHERVEASSFPGNWPADWPHGNVMEDGSTVHDWLAWPQPFRDAIANWPSDFAAILDPQAVVARIEFERNQDPSVLDGITTISGRFVDGLGTVWNMGAGGRLYADFSYRVRNPGWDDVETTVWETRRLYFDEQYGDLLSAADWVIELSPDDHEGERVFDVSFGDAAGNVTTVLGIRFFLDTDDPFFFAGDNPDLNRNNPDLFTVVLGLGLSSDRTFDGLLDPQMPDDHPVSGRLEAERRIFSAVGAESNNDRVFRLQGSVQDVNLRQLTATIGSGGEHPHRIVARHDMTANPPADDEQGFAHGRRRLGLAPLSNGNGWAWTLDILQRDVVAFGMNGEISVSLVATDVANRSTVVEWPFLLDSTPPNVVFQQNDVHPGDDYDVPLGGSSVRDPIAGVRDIRLAVARRNYAQAGRWEWFGYAAGAWTPAPSEWYYVSFTGDRAWVSWEVPSLAGVIAPHAVTEGQYRMAVMARDRSLHWLGADRDGNPVTAGDTDADPAVFFVDRGGPSIARGGDTGRQVFNTNDHTGNLEFVFYISDPNTVAYFRARILNAAGTYTHIDNVPHDITGDPWGTQRVTLSPDMGTLPDAEYTLHLIVRDAAGNYAEVNHTVRFDLGNTLPLLAVNTVSMAAGMVTGANNALVGPVTIRGATTEGSGRIVDVRYALVPVARHDENMNDAFFRTLDWETGYWYTSDNPILRMGDNPGVAWTIDIPNTRNIMSTANAQVMGSYVPVAPMNRSLYWNGSTADREVHRVVLALRAEDLAGNVSFMPKDLWIYPGGDRPTARILWPAPDALMGGPFTIRGDARDNERVESVFFRIRINDVVRGDMLIPNFNADGEMQDGYQDAREIPGHGSGWFMASSNRFGFTDWWAPVNTYGELNPGLRGTTNLMRIEVLAKDAAYLGPGLGVDGWDSVNFTTGEPYSLTANVVSGLPMFAEERILRLAHHATGGWVPSDEWGVPLPQVSPDNATWRTPAEVHMGGSGRATFRFEIRHEIGLRSIMFDGIDLLDPDNPYNNFGATGTPAANTFQGALNRMNTANVPATGGLSNETFGSGIAARVVLSGVTTSLGAEHSGRTFMIWGGTEGGGLLHRDLPGIPNERFTAFTVPHGIGAIDLDGVELIERTAGEEFFTWTVLVEVNTNIIAGGYFRGGSGQFRLPITATDRAEPNANSYTRTWFLPIDNSPPAALYELTVRPAGSAATLGGSAGAGAGDVGGVDRVVVWFQRYIGTGTQRVYQPVSWWRDGASGFIDNNNTFQPGETIRVFRPEAVGDDDEGWGTQLLPQIPAGGTGGYSAIVINRNDPQGTLPPQFGNRIATGWVPGGLGQIWNFTIDSLGLAPGPVNMHFVVFDRAGNATHQVQPLIVMNNAPAIGQIRLATDIRGSTALQEQLGSGTGNVSGATGILNHFRNYAPLAVPPGLTAEESDIRRGITPPITPATQVISHTQTGARHHIDNFTVRNSLLAMHVQTTQEPHEARQRTFRMDYVSGATRLSGAQIGNIRAGMMYIVQNPGPTVPDANDNQPIPWQTLGASHGVVHAGYAFLAAIDAPAETFNWGDASVWELDTAGPAISDHVFPGNHNFADELPAAEFAFRNAAFGTGTGQIRDHNPANTGFGGTTWVEGYSLFIVKVFDGDEDDVFADFTLLSIRVNNNDQTPPFAQLYDLNPMSENLGPAAATPPGGLVPLAIGQNRTRGGLWRDDNLGNLSRPGHIEPRRIRNAANTAYTHSLTPTEMGEDPNAPDWESVYPAAFFAVDTVSGRVVLRGYAEDDQRVGGVVLEFTSTAAGTPLLERIPILRSRSTIGAPVPGTETVPASTGLLESAQGNNVLFTDSIDLYRHRVEWAFVWDTAAFPANTVVGNITVRAIAVNATTTPDNILSGTLPTGTSISPAEAVGRTAAAVRGAGVMGRSHVGMLNYGFPEALQMYNQIRVNIRPYITGFRRDANEGFNNTRSLQGRFPFSRGETVVVTGFNLGGTGATTVSLPEAAGISTYVPSTADRGSFGIGAGLTDAEVASRYRMFEIPVDAVTGNGLVTLAVGTYHAANTSSERTPLHIQPWNTERSLAAGSDLWDNVTRVHIWQSDDATTGYNQGSFPASTPGWPVFGASMSIDPQIGVLHSSHNEGGDGNMGRVFIGTNEGDRETGEAVGNFPDPIINSSIFVNEQGDPWAVYSAIGRAGGGQNWDVFGGVWVHGPEGGGIARGRGPSSYPVESTWHSGSEWSDHTIHPFPLDQFRNPSVVTHDDGTFEHIHVAYFDSESGSIRYRYNRRGFTGDAFTATTAGNNDGGGTSTVLGLGNPGWNTSTAAATMGGQNRANHILRAWTNLDGGIAARDNTPLAPTTVAGDIAATVAGFPVGTGDIGPFPRLTGANARVVNPTTRTTTRAGEHNDIAVTSQGFPVIVYFDETNNTLRMAISNSVTPVAGSAWHIVDSVIPANAAAPFLALREGTGRYVSMRIDTRPNNTPVGSGSVQNRVHISAFNNITNSLVYIRGIVVAPTVDWTTANSAAAWMFEEAVVVGGVGNVGRRSAISLDGQGRPWIAFLDTRNLRGRDGVKVAFRDTALFPRAQTDMHGNSILGWETMHVPAQFNVRDEQNFRFTSQLGMENFPTRNFTGTPNPETRFWGAAVGFMSDDLFRIAYWVR